MTPDRKRTLRERFGPLPPDPAADREIARRVLAHPACLAAKRVFCFVGQPGEIDTAPLLDGLLAAGKEVFVPVSLPKGRMLLRRLTDRAALTDRDRYGIPIPPEGTQEAEAETICLALVPGVCFSSDGSRLGRGGGYYDRFLEHFSGTALGLCRKERMMEQIPMDRHDCRVDQVITSSGENRRNGHGENHGGR